MTPEDKFNPRTNEGFDFRYHRTLSTSGRAIIFNCIFCGKELCQDPYNLNRWMSEGIVCSFCRKGMTAADLLLRVVSQSAEIQRLKEEIATLKAAARPEVL